MKIFKTILWTTFFWIIVLACCYGASYFYPQESSVIVPKRVKTIIVENANINCTDSGLQESVNMLPEEIDETYVEDEPAVDAISVSEEDSSSLYPAQQGSDTDIQALQQRVATLEDEYLSLVSELQQIFSTPALADLLAQPVAQEQVLFEE